MKKNILLIICLVYCLFANAGNIDSILFSTDGKFVLIIGTPIWDDFTIYDQNDTTTCPSKFNLYNIEFNKFIFEQGVSHHNNYEGYINGTYGRDSVFRFLKNMNSSAIRKNKKKDFITKYNLKQKGIIINKFTTLKIDTLNVFKVDEGFTKKLIDHYVIKINLIFNKQAIFSQVITTAEPSLINLNLFKIYTSEDNKFYFLYGTFEITNYQWGLSFDNGHGIHTNEHFLKFGNLD